MQTPTSAARSGRTVRTGCARRAGAPVGAAASGGSAAPAMQAARPPRWAQRPDTPRPRQISTAGAVRGVCQRPAGYPARPASRVAAARPRRPQNAARRKARRRRILRRRLALLLILTVAAGLLTSYEPLTRLSDALAPPVNALLKLTGLRLQPAATAPSAPAAPLHDGITEAERAALDELCAEMPGSFSLILLDLEGKDRYAFQPDIPYTAASLVKAPYALWLCRRADAGEIDLAQPIPYPADCRPSSGMLAEYAGQEMIDPALLMTAMLAQSSNEAARALAAYWPTDEAFHAFLREELRFSRPESCRIDPKIRGSVTARDLQNTFEALNAYFAGGAAHAEPLRQMMLKADHQILYLPADVPAAKKYGSWDGAFHDAAIVYAPHPYLVVALSDWGDREIDRPPEAVERMRQAGRLAWAVTQDQSPPEE